MMICILRVLMPVLAAASADAAGVGERPAREMTNSIGMEFVRIEPAQAGGQPFYLGKTEVTFAQYRRFRPDHDNGKTEWGRVLDSPDLPVLRVSPLDAGSFCQWLNQRDGGEYRLPTTLEWQQACQAGRKARYVFGDSPFSLKYHAWYNDNAMGLMVAKGERGPRWVGQKLPTERGLFDVHGNVWEWCADSGGQYLAKGGAWNSSADQCSLSTSYRPPMTGDISTGFRLVMVKPSTSGLYGHAKWERLGTTLFDALLARADADTLPPKGSRVAVMPLGSDGRATSELGLMIAGGIESAVMGAGKYRVVDRRTIDTVLTEKDLAYADLTDLSKTAQASKAMAADVLITGHLTDGASEVQGDVRLVKVSSGQVLAGHSFSLPKDEDVRSLMVWVQRPQDRKRPGGELPPLILSYDVLAQRAVSSGGFEEVLVREGATLRSGDQYRIRVQVSSDCHFYILTRDSRGEVYVLFPRPEIRQGGAIRGGVTYRIPGEQDPWYTLDENTGNETLIFIAAYEPLDNLDTIVRQMQAAGGPSATASAALDKEVERLSTDKATGETAAGFVISRTRGTVLSRPKAAYTLGNGRQIENIMAVAEGRTRVVQIISFKHE